MNSTFLDVKINGCGLTGQVRSENDRMKKTGRVLIPS